MRESGEPLASGPGYFELKNGLPEYNISNEEAAIHIAFAENHINRLTKIASWAKKQSASYRNFFVGCAALGVRGLSKDGSAGKPFFYDAYAAANFTPIKKDPPARGINKNALKDCRWKLGWLIR